MNEGTVLRITCRDTARHVEEIVILPIGMEVGGKNARLIRGLNHRSTRTIAGQADQLVVLV